MDSKGGRGVCLAGSSRMVLAEESLSDALSCCSRVFARVVAVGDMVS